MPVYEYQCHDCGIVFDARQKFADAPLTACTACGGRVEKLISLAGFALKGGGWHQSGYSAGTKHAGGLPERRRGRRLRRLPQGGGQRVGADPKGLESLRPGEYRRGAVF